MALLKFRDIQLAQDFQTEDVPVPEWGGDVRIRTLTAAERDEWEGSNVRQRGRKTETVYQNFRARLCALCMIDEDGKRIVSEEQVFDLGQKSGPALDRVYEACVRLNRISKEDVDFFEAGSKTTHKNGSSSTLQPTSA